MLYMLMYMLIFMTMWSLSFTEGEDDLHDVKKEVSDLAAHWIHISDSLRIPEHIQSTIKRDYSKPIYASEQFSLLGSKNVTISTNLDLPRGGF